MAKTQAQIRVTVSQDAPALEYVGFKATNQGMPQRTSIAFGKHSQWIHAEGRILVTSGDVSAFRIASNGYRSDGCLRATLAYDIGTTGPIFEEIYSQMGIAGEIWPGRPDGVTYVWNSRERLAYLIYGFGNSGVPSGSASTPLEPGTLDKVLAFNPSATETKRTGTGVSVPPRRWRAAADRPPGAWLGEHWGGAYWAHRNEIVLERGGGRYGQVLRYSCDTGMFTAARIPANMPGRLGLPGVAMELASQHWRQYVDERKGELLCFDGYRGDLVAIDLETLASRRIANVPRIAWDGITRREPVGAVEQGIAFDTARRRWVMFTDTHMSDTEGQGIVVVLIDDGKVFQVDYPADAYEFRHGRQKKIANHNQAVFDATNDLVVGTGGSGLANDMKLRLYRNL